MNFLVCFSIIVLLHECLCSPCKTYTEETLLEDPSVIDFFWDPINETVDEASRDNLDNPRDKSEPNFLDETVLEDFLEKFLKETLEEPVDNLDNPRDKSEPNFLDETLLEDPLVKFIWDTVEKPVDNVSGDNLDKSVDKSVPTSHKSLENPVVKSFQDTFGEASVNHTDKDKSLEKSGPNSNKFLEDELDTVFRNGFKEPIDKASGDNLDKTVHKSVPNFTPLIKYIVDTIQECVDSVVRDNLDKSVDKSVPNSDNPLEDPVVKAFLDTDEEVPGDHSDKDKSLNKSGLNSNESLEDALVTHYQNTFKVQCKVSGDKTDRPVDKSVPNFLDEPLRKTSHDKTLLDIFDEPLDTVLRDNLRKKVHKLVLNDVLSDPLDKFSRGS
ncbi:uncharacterized protein LOC110382253 [Helicoverpa armigera]|uniref:uncharacterized protein LOC110382253 n=1 Tax=Helicoverpa armigera TaxID=29058 RepID=UPI003083BBA3